MEGGRGEEICEGGVTSALATPKCLACRRRARRRFIGARPIKARHRNTEQAIVNRELRPMMNDMVQHHPANAGNLRHREDCLAPRLQGPVLHHVCIARTRKRRPRFGCILVKLRQQLLPVFYFRRLIGRPLHRCVIEFFGLQRHADPARHRRDMSRQPPQSAGLFMGLPAPLLVRSALQYFPSVLHFLIEFWQHRLSHGHVVLLLSLNSERRYLRRIKSEMSSLDSLAPRPHNPSLVAARLYPPHLNAWRSKIPVQRDEIYVTPERGITHYGSPVDHLSPRRFDRFVSLLQKTRRTRHRTVPRRRIVPHARRGIQFPREYREAYVGKHAFALDRFSSHGWRKTGPLSRYGVRRTSRNARGTARPVGKRLEMCI